MKKSRERGKFDLIKSAMRSPWKVKKVLGDVHVDSFFVLEDLLEKVL